MQPGDLLDVWTTGGGGYGDPLERAPEMVLSDVLDRKVTADAARAAYGVVVNGRGVDKAATVVLRDEMRGARGDTTWRYDRGALGKE